MNNDKKYRDRQYMNIVSDILEHDEFDKMENIVHHGMDRKSHSLRVSYYSYKLSKFLRLDYDSVARAGLLHDFFLQDNKDSSTKERLTTLVNHPKYALENAKEYFDLNDVEQDIIVSHMFHVTAKLPKYMESWVVNLVDDVVAIVEIGFKTRTKLTYAANFLLLFMFTYLR